MSCNFKEVKTDYYTHEKDGLEDFRVHQTIIIKEPYLKHITGCRSKKDRLEVAGSDEWYPFANSYYPYTEDVDALARVNHLLANKPSFVSISSSEYQDEIEEVAPYSEKSAHIQYLQSNPVSFIILGKPSIGEEELGRQLADYWQCVYIDPQIIIEQEIASGSRVGQCIEFNLRCGRAIGIDVILRLVEKRVKSESAKHRGFVICGLPLIPNDLYEEDPISSESAVFNVKEIFDEVLDTVIEVGVPPSKPHVSISSKYVSEDDVEGEETHEKGKDDIEEEEDEKNELHLPKRLPEKPQEPEMPVDLGADYDVCSSPEIGTSYEDQLNFLFNLMKNPFLIIYLMCSTTDVINKRKNHRFDIYSKQIIDLQTENFNKLLYNYFSVDLRTNNEDLPEEFFETGYFNIDTSNMKHLVTLPRNFPSNVSTQLDAYHYTALNFIERRILMHDPQHFLKVSGNTTIQRMFHIVKSRLKILPFQKVILPAKLNVVEEVLDVGEAEPYVFKTEGLTFEECFKEFCKRQIPSSIFKWNWSNWGTKCPVSMREGYYKDGDPNFAVRFMNKMYFLADETAFLKFYRNPRPYLLPPYPKTSCKFFIFGPKCSGKSALAKCLAYLFNGTVLSMESMLENFITQKEDEYKEKIRQAAIAEAMKILNDQRKEEAIEKENQRVAGIKEWIVSVKELIEQLIVLFEEKEKEQTVTTFEISSFPMAMRRVSVMELETEVTIAIGKLRDQLESYKIPFYDFQIEDWNGLLKDKKKLLIYLPNHLKFKIQPKPATIFDDFVTQYANDAVAQADLGQLDINNKNMTDMLISSIRTIEESYLEQGNNRGGWVIDGMMCDLPLINDLYPDYIADEIIVLQESDNFEFLTNRYKDRGKNEFKEYREYFLSIGKIDAAWRCPSITSTKSYKTRLTHNIISGILDDETLFPDEDGERGDRQTSKRIELYGQELLKFNESWEEVKNYFLERNIHPMEIQVTDKSLPELMTDAIKAVEDRYRVSASVFTDEDRAEEVKMFGDAMMKDDEIGEEPDAPKADEENSLEKNRRYGDTSYYCPVTFYEQWVLWKGKEDYAVKFDGKIYLLSNAENMNKFLESPRSYLTEKPPREFPPPRVCIIGLPGIGKTSVSKVVAENFGLSYVSFESLIKKHFDIDSKTSLTELRYKEDINENLSKYLNSGEPLPNEILESIICRFWFKHPVKSSGFVLDDFPKRPSDIEFMVRYKLIPDVILNLTNNVNDVKNKLLDDCLNQWQLEINKKRQAIEEKNKKILSEWEIKRKQRYEELIEERRERRYALKRKEKTETPKDTTKDRPYMEDLKETDEETDRSSIKSASQVSFDSVAEQEDVDEVNRILEKELPELIIDEALETFEAAKERFSSALNENVDIENEFVEANRNICNSELITLTDITSEFDYPERTVRNVLFVVDKFKYRTESFFERCYDVSMEVADRLLYCGYFLLSKFGKTCPVQYNENKIPFQMFLPMEQKYNIFPVIHRNFIYYIIGKENQLKFKEDPFKYISIKHVNFPLIPFKVAITGPPKCGKTTLADRIKAEYGLRVISRGQAVRYVLSYLPFSNLAENMENVLRNGWELTDEMVAKCVEAASIDSKAVTQGIIFDGFPNTLSEVKHLSHLGLVPNLVIDLQASQMQIYECLANDSGKRGLPKYGKYFIEHIFNQWSKTSDDFRKWFDQEYQVTSKISIDTCNWSVWAQARDFINAVFFEIKHYYMHISEDWPVRLSNMQVTPLEFLERRSAYRNFCPCCLHYSNILTSGGDPPDRTGLVQFRKHFYWLCPNHIETFLKTPEAFLPPYNNHALPQQLPTVLNIKTLPENVFEDGACVICYKHKRVIAKGHLTHAVGYNFKVYLFDDKQCMTEFMTNPSQFLFDISFKPPDNYPSLNYRELPPLGMLEQYVAKPVIKALNYISRRRPVIPGLSIQASAAIGIGLYLKVYNDNISQEYKIYYREADSLYQARRTKLINFLDKMKSVINPYLHYEEPMPQFEIPPTPPKSESSVSIKTYISKLVDGIVDNIDYNM